MYLLVFWTTLYNWERTFSFLFQTSFNVFAVSFSVGTFYTLLWPLTLCRTVRDWWNSLVINSVHCFLRVVYHLSRTQC